MLSMRKSSLLTYKRGCLFVPACWFQVNFRINFYSGSRFGCERPRVRIPVEPPFSKKSTCSKIAKVNLPTIRFYKISNNLSYGPHFQTNNFHQQMYDWVHMIYVYTYFYIYLSLHLYHFQHLSGLAHDRCICSSSFLSLYFVMALRLVVVF